mmetsp:Transcript_25279/g.53266  ORF Transcript_25279/g.53266 Transcript_25279/m.53266 type:complete len:96 (-) Transcript_25279:2783-3070(-)
MVQRADDADRLEKSRGEGRTHERMLNPSSNSKRRSGQSIRHRKNNIVLRCCITNRKYAKVKWDKTHRFALIGECLVRAWRRAQSKKTGTRRTKAG